MVTIALDLEGVLISNAVSRFPRPGLSQFVSACRRHADRLVLYTSVRSEVARSILDELVKEGLLPENAFDAIVHASGSTKPLAGIADILFDDAADVAADEQDRLVRVPGYDPMVIDDATLFELTNALPATLSRTLRRETPMTD